MKRTYLTSVAPGLVGLGVGVLITWVPGPSDYLTESAFHLWQGVVIVQVSVFGAAAAYLLVVASDSRLPKLSLQSTLSLGLITIAALVLPNLTFVRISISDLPLGANQGYRLLPVVGLGVGAMVLLTNRLARIYIGYPATQRPDQHSELRSATQDLLVIAGTAITLALLGGAALQASIPESTAALTRGHMLAYGGYSSALLLWFFAPVYGAERVSATRLRDRISSAGGSLVEGALDLDSSVVQRLVAAGGVLSPLLGVLATQFLRSVGG